jgi:hypothetical protein
MAFTLLLMVTLSLPLQARSAAGIETLLIEKLQAKQPLPRPAQVSGAPKAFIFGQDIVRPLSSLPASATPEAIATADARLTVLAPLFAWPPPAVPESLSVAPGDECAFELGATALRYRADPDANRDRFFALLAIDDYVARAAGQVELLGREDLGKAVDAVFGRRPGLDVRVLQELAAFCALRERDVWFQDTKEGPKSFARAVRLKMVQNLLAGTDEVEDVPGVVRLIDATTDQRHVATRDARHDAEPETLSPAQQKALAVRLEALGAFLDAPKTPLPTELHPTPADHCAAELVATALMYRADPAAHRARFHALLEIDDFAERAGGKQNVVWAEDLEPVLTAAYSRVPTLRDDRLRTAVAYCALARSRPLVITASLERIPLARIVRSIALALLLDGTGEDTDALLAGIDARLEQEYATRLSQVPTGN